MSTSRIRCRWFWITQLCLWSAVTVEAVAPTYTVVQVPTLGGTFNQAYSVNDFAGVTGQSRLAGDLTYQAFLRRPIGTVQGIPILPGYPHNYGSWVNNSEWIVGFSYETFGLQYELDRYRAYVWQQSTGSVPLPLLSGYAHNLANKVNNAAEIAGSGYYWDGGTVYRPVRWKQESGSWVVLDLGSLGGTQGEGIGVNNVGQIVGYSSTGLGSETDRAFLWKNNIMYNLGSFGSDAASYASTINSSGKVVGFSYFNLGTSTYSAFLWTPTIRNGTTGTMANIGIAPGFEVTSAYGINASGQIVGTGYKTGAGYRAMLWHGSGVFDLNTLIQPGCGHFFWLTRIFRATLYWREGCGGARILLWERSMA